MCEELREFIVERVELGEEELVILDGLDNLEMEVDHKEQEVEVYNGKKFYNDVWDVSLVRGDVTMQLVYKQGEGWYGETPLTKNVLYSLLSDYYAFKNSLDFEDYCANYGMEVYEEFETFEEEEEAEDGYNKKSKAIYKLVEMQVGEIETLFSGEELEFLSEVYQDY